MIKVKVTTPGPHIPIIRMTPGSKGVVGNYKFFVNEPINRADWWVVTENLSKKERASCPPGNTILITNETEFVKTYKPKFVNQFNWMLTSNRKISHPRVIKGQQGYGSYLFMSRRQHEQSLEEYQNQFKTYDELNAMTDIPKTKLLSVVASHKVRIPGAIARNNFIKKMKEHFGDKLDVFSNLPNVFGPDTLVKKFKWDSVAPYKYHLAIENSCVPDYWTDKILDAYIAGAYPIYYGHESVYNYFPRNSLSMIDINDIPGSIKTIEKVISENYYDKYRDDVWKARDLALNKYNVFQTIVDTINSLPSSNDYKKITLKPESHPILKMKQYLIKKINKVPIFRVIAKKTYRKYRAIRHGEIKH